MQFANSDIFCHGLKAFHLDLFLFCILKIPLGGQEYFSKKNANMVLAESSFWIHALREPF